MADERPELIASALRRLAGDLVTERRRALALERENRQLREMLDALARPEEEQPRFESELARR